MGVEALSTFPLEKYRKKTDANLLISYWKHGMYHSTIKFDFYTTSENRYNYMHTRGKTTKSQNVKQFVQSNWESNI